MRTAHNKGIERDAGFAVIFFSPRVSCPRSSCPALDSTTRNLTLRPIVSPSVSTCTSHLRQKTV